VVRLGSPSLDTQQGENFGPGFCIAGRPIMKLDATRAAFEDVEPVALDIQLFRRLRSGSKVTFLAVVSDLEKTVMDIVMILGWKTGDQ